jgi:hypothetical protein
MDPTGRWAVFLVLVVVLTLASSCGGTAEPEERPVMLKALPGASEIPIHKEFGETGWEDPVIAHLPPGTECTCFGDPRLESAGLSQLVTMCKVSCNGTIGFVNEENLVFAP